MTVETLGCIELYFCIIMWREQSWKVTEAKQLNKLVVEEEAEQKCQRPRKKPQRAPWTGARYSQNQRNSVCVLKF